MYELGEEYFVFKYGILLLFTICLSHPHNQWHLIREGLFFLMLASAFIHEKNKAIHIKK